MSALHVERVLSVRHWNDALFSFSTTRNTGFRFQNGQFVMIGLEVDGRPLLRAFSLVSANYDEELEFFSIKVPGGALTSRLQHVEPGHPILVGKKPTGTLLLDNLRPGKRLCLLGTGTGLAPFLSILRDPETYERFEEVVIAHGVRRVSDLAYKRYIEEDLSEHVLVGDQVKRKLRYYPTVTREPFPHQGRLTALLESGQLFADLAVAPLSAEQDRFMICGGPHVLRDLTTLLESRGFDEGSTGNRGRYVIERAFVEK